MIIIINGFPIPGAATFGGRIRNTSCEADIRIQCCTFRDDTGLAFVGEYPKDRDLIVAFLTWQCRQFVPFNAHLEFAWYIKHSCEELSMIQDTIVREISKQYSSPEIRSFRYLTAIYGSRGPRSDLSKILSEPSPESRLP